MDEVCVLVLGISGNVSQSIVKALRISSANLRIVGACVNADTASRFWCDKTYISPYANAHDFLDWLIDVIAQEKIQLILTGVEEVLQVLAENRHAIEANSQARLVLCSVEQLAVGRSKIKTCEWLQAYGCNHPFYCASEDRQLAYDLRNQKGFPLIAKPDIGKGSAGIHIIQTDVELERILELPNYVIQEYIGDYNREYTVGCYADRYGSMVEPIVMHRQLQYGTTIVAEVVDHEEIKREAKKICSFFRPAGPLNIQMRLDKSGHAVCFEMNVRFSGTTAMRAHFGFRDVEAAVREYVLHQDIADCFSVKQGKAYRYWEEYYV